MFSHVLKRRAVQIWSVGARLADCVKGTAAIEFGYIAPLMVMLFVGTIELSQAITVDRRVALVASSTADIISRQRTVTTASLNAYMQMIAHLLAPYDEAPLKMTVTNVYSAAGTGAVTPLVCWTYDRDDTAAKGVSTQTAGQQYIGTMPTGIVENGSSVVVVQVRYEYQPYVFSTFYITTMLPMVETFYMKPRLSASVQKDGQAACV